MCIRDRNRLDPNDEPKFENPLPYELWNEVNRSLSYALFVEDPRAPISFSTASVSAALFESLSLIDSMAFELALASSCFS